MNFLNNYNKDYVKNVNRVLNSKGFIVEYYYNYFYNFIEGDTLGMTVSLDKSQLTKFSSVKNLFVIMNGLNNKYIINKKYRGRYLSIYDYFFSKNKVIIVDRESKKVSDKLLDDFKLISYDYIYDDVEVGLGYHINDYINKFINYDDNYISHDEIYDKLYTNLSLFIENVNKEFNKSLRLVLDTFPLETYDDLLIDYLNSRYYYINLNEKISHHLEVNEIDTNENQLPIYFDKILKLELCDILDISINYNWYDFKLDINGEIVKRPLIRIKDEKNLNYGRIDRVWDIIIKRFKEFIINTNKDKFLDFDEALNILNFKIIEEDDNYIYLSFDYGSFNQNNIFNIEYIDKYDLSEIIDKYGIKIDKLNYKLRYNNMLWDDILIRFYGEIEDNFIENNNKMDVVRYMSQTIYYLETSMALLEYYLKDETILNLVFE